VTDEELELLEKWIRAEFALRTYAIAHGIHNVDWLDPHTRVSYTDIASKATDMGIRADPFEFRERMQEMSKSLLRWRSR